MPRLTHTTSPGPRSRVSSPIVIRTEPSMIAITCSVCSCAWRGTCLPGWYCTRHSSSWSPPMACRCTPSTNSNGSTPFQELKPDPSGMDAPVGLAAVGRHGLDRELLVEDDPLALAARLLLLLQGVQDALRRDGELRHPDADRVVDRRGDRRRLRVIGHLADRLRPERPVLGRVLEDRRPQLGEVLERRRQVGA